MSISTPLKGDGNGHYRIKIVGNSGVGKSTVAAQLSQMLGDIPYISLDAIFWKQNWETATTDEFKAKLKQELEKDERGWVVDGNYHSKLGDYVEMQATDIIWLDPPFVLYFPRLCYRTLLRIFNLCPPCSPGCDETWNAVLTRGDKSIVWWCWTNHDIVREREAANMAKNKDVRRRIGGWGSDLQNWLEDVKKMVRDT